MDSKDEIKLMPISELVERGMSQASFEKLSKMGINTIGELLEVNTALISNEYQNIRRIVMNMGLFFNDDRVKWKNAGISDEIAMKKINDLDLPIRLKNALTRRADFICLGDLLTTDYNSILHTRNVGETHMNELKNYVHSLGLSLQNEKLPMKEIKENLKEKGIMLVGEALKLDVKTSSVLYKNEIYTVEDLINFGSKVYNLMEMTGFKKKKLEAALNDRNIKLKDSNETVENTQIAIKPTKEMVENAAEENQDIKNRTTTIEELIEQYNKLIKERKSLVEQEIELSKKIASMQNKKGSNEDPSQGSNGGRK